MDPSQEFNERLNPSPTESGLYNLISDVGVHARDDGCLELYAGQASILIDGQTGTITINGRKINQTAEFVNTLPKPNAMNIGNGSVNPALIPSSAESLAGAIADDPRVNPKALARSPMVATNPGVLTLPLVIGAPSYGQTTVTLGEILKPVPVFRRSAKDTSLLEKLESILRSL